MSKTISGQLIFDSPVYRGNSKKTIFTRGNSSREVSLPGRIGGSAQAMMSAFSGFWQNHKNPNMSNYGLMDQLWQRLYGENMPNFNQNVSCTIDSTITSHEPHFDMRMGIAIDRDRMAQAEGQNFRLETVYKGSRFNFQLTFDENRLNNGNKAKLACLLEEMVCGRFWFGAQKSKGMGKCHLELDNASQQIVSDYKNANNQQASLNPAANYTVIYLNIKPNDTPLLVSMPWGHKDEKGDRDTWIDSLSKETEEHRAIMDSVRSDQARTWADVEQMPGGTKFKNNHLRRGEPMDLGQLNRNFPKAIQNDDTLMSFLQGYRDKVHAEIDRRPHLDFREQDGAVVRGKAYDQLFYRSLTWNSDKATWELIIPGNTIKGAFRTKAQQILRTLKNGKGCSEKTSSHEGRFCDDRHCPVCNLFGRQGQIAKVFCSDAFLEADDRLVDDEHFSYDQIGIDPKTGKTIDSTKLNFLYAYGQKFPFRCSLVIKDLDTNNMGHMGFLMYLLRELNDGNIPIGGKKTLGFGYVKGSVDKIEFLCAPGSPLEETVSRWNGQSTGADNLWNRYELKEIWNNEAFRKDMEQGFSALIGKPDVPQAPFRTKAGYVSHRQNSQLCGALIYEIEALTPLYVKESGEPSFQGEDAFGYDFFSITPPRNDQKLPMNQREYAIPPSTLKGAVRNIYNIISNPSCPGCSRINSLCDTCRLFGWVGSDISADNALMGRLTFGFARPTKELVFEWYGTAFGYKGEKSHSVDGNRIFPHTNNPNNAITRHGSGETPENIVKNITLNRFAVAGSKFQFQVGFTNLENDELNKILWAIGLEDGLAHKLGKGKALGFGSCAVRLKDAYIINWEERFSSLAEPGLGYLNIERLKANPKPFANYEELKRAMTIAQ